MLSFLKSTTAAVVFLVLPCMVSLNKSLQTVGLRLQIKLESNSCVRLEHDITYCRVTANWPQVNAESWLKGLSAHSKCQLIRTAKPKAKMVTQ